MGLLGGQAVEWLDKGLATCGWPLLILVLLYFFGKERFALWCERRKLRTSDPDAVAASMRAARDRQQHAARVASQLAAEIRVDDSSAGESSLSIKAREAAALLALRNRT